MYGFFGGRQIKFNLSPSDKNAQTNTANGSKSWITNNRLYTAREYDQELDLYYYRGRSYDARMGRFIQRDPIGYADDVNLYTYVGNNPMNYTDPWGLSPKSLTFTFDNEKAKEVYDMFIHKNIPDYEMYRKPPQKYTCDTRNPNSVCYVPTPKGNMYACPQGGCITPPTPKDKKLAKLDNFVTRDLVNVYDVYNNCVGNTTNTCYGNVCNGGMRPCGGAVFGAAVDIGTFLIPAGKTAKVETTAEKIVPKIVNTAKDTLLNKLNHIFGKAAHNLSQLLEVFSSREAAYNAVFDAIKKSIKNIEGTFEKVVKVGGFDVTVRGKIVNGVVKIGTFFIK